MSTWPVVEEEEFGRKIRLGELFGNDLMTTSPVSEEEKEEQFQSIIRFGEIEEIDYRIDHMFRSSKNFNVLSSPPFDHHFLFGRKQSLMKQMYSATNYRDQKRYIILEEIEQEWRILKANLPNYIFVNVYESRPDLIRACMIGLEGTPYCYGLFFFDILLSPNYPHTPPQIFYHSDGFDLNPNLHKDGKVSVHIKANSEQSSVVLQALLAIQETILSGRPFSDASSKSRNEVFMLSCEAMLFRMKNAPSNFEDFTLGHFRRRAHWILLVYKNQMRRHDSKEMRRLFFRLVKAFEEKGVYCHHHYSEEELKNFTEEETLLEKKLSLSKYMNKLKSLVYFSLCFHVVM